MKIVGREVDDWAVMILTNAVKTNVYCGGVFVLME